MNEGDERVFVFSCLAFLCGLKSRRVRNTWGKGEEYAPRRKGEGR